VTRQSVNRLGILEALNQAWKPLDGGDVEISVHAGDRNRMSRGARFIVTQEGRPICCVKKLPLAGTYDPAAILVAQKAFGSLKAVRVPEILGSVQDDQNWFIVEEFIPNGMGLDEAARLNVYPREEAEKLIARILEEIDSAAIGGVDTKQDEARIISAIEFSCLSQRHKASLRAHVFSEMAVMFHPPVWTSRDFLPRNILLSDGRPYLIDFDLACRTGMLGADVMRVEFYTGWKIPFWPSQGARRDDLRIHLLFLILEQQLQSNIASASHYRTWMENYAPEIEKLASHLPSESGPGRSARLASARQQSEIPIPSAKMQIVPPSPTLVHMRTGVISRIRHRLGRGLARASVMRPGLEALRSDLFKARIRLATPWKKIAGPPLNYHVDVPGDWNMPDLPTIVSGWCFSSAAPIEGIRAIVNGEIHDGVYGLERRDVQKSMRDMLTTPSVGFWVRCPVRRGYNHLKLEAMHQGQWILLCKSARRAAYFPIAQVGDTYQRYIELEQRRLRRMSIDLAHEGGEFPIRPLISVVMPVYRSNIDLLGRAVDSVRKQLYANWELCIVDDASNDEKLSELLRSLGDEDPKIKVKVRQSNGNISAATNDGIAMSTGEWIAFLDHDDELTPDALLEVVRTINVKPACDVVYTDQDKMDSEQHRFEPFFKPDWSPVFLWGVMYVGHLLVARKKLVEEAGGCDGRFDGVQDFELMLRMSERTNRVEHIPRILYHWRAIAGSVAASGAAKKGIEKLQERAVQAHLERLGIAATAHRVGRAHRVRVFPQPRTSYPKVSILIPTRDHPELLGRCLKTLFDNTQYPNFEVLIGDNETRDKRALEILGEYPVRIIPLAGQFHFSRFNNVLAEEAGGEYLMLLNNDTEIVQRDWLENLLLYAQPEDAGAVGALLTYGDGTIQHAGIILGPRGTADHLMRGFPQDVDGYMGSLACPREVTAVTAAAAMIHRRKFKMVGGFCERFQRHYDDLDFCLRLRSRGFRNIFVPTAKLVHHESRSRGAKYDFTDRVLLLDRWESMIDRGDPYYSRNFDGNSTDYRVGLGGIAR
jgi:O-antigen biosynthesis protein